MKRLTEQDVLDVMREEWGKRVESLKETIDVMMKSPDGKDLLSPELKVRHKNSQIKYTIDSVGPRSVVLRAPEGTKFIVDASEMENSYELD